MLAAAGLFRLRQQGSDDLFRLMLRLCRNIKRIETVFHPAGDGSGLNAGRLRTSCNDQEIPR
jgi:hypothetical protein